MKKAIIILISLMGLLLGKEKIKLEKGEYEISFYSVVYKIEGNKIDLGENGELILEKPINEIVSLNKEFLKDTLSNPISIDKIEYPALFAIHVIVKGIHEIIPGIVKNTKKVIGLEYIGGKQKAEEYIRYWEEIYKQR
jgi:hypothetical protein